MRSGVRLAPPLRVQRQNGSGSPTCGRLPPPFVARRVAPYLRDMRFESKVVSVSWIPSEAVKGMGKAAFESGVTHYDLPLPDVIEDLDSLRDNDRFRFANELSAWIDVDDGRIVGAGYTGGGLMGSTTLRLGPASMVFQAVGLPDIQRDPQMSATSVRFVQTAGGRAGIPAPRRVRRKPFVQLKPPLVWTTLALTINVDGSSTYEVVGASRFPRHWIYDQRSKLAAKVGLADFKDWYRNAFGKHSPWGDEDSPALVTAAETALERALSTTIMRGGAKPEIREVSAGTELVTEGDKGDEVFLLLDGVLRAEKGGERLVEYGPGALLGERAVLEGGRRTATLVAVTPCRVAAARSDQLDRDALLEVSQGHRHEEK